MGIPVYILYCSKLNLMEDWFLLNVETVDKPSKNFYVNECKMFLKRLSFIFIFSIRPEAAAV